MTFPRDELNQVTDTILDTGSGPGELFAAVNDLHRLCSSIVGLEPEADDGEADRETKTEHGRALAPRDAARCTLDLARTSAFLRGCHEAIGVLLNRFSGRRINLLYAGTGPFAPLALPLTTRFDPEHLGITFIDAHPYSVDSVRRLIDAFEASAWCSALHSCDAMDYVHPVSEPLHMVIIETMQRLLAKEPQVALTEVLAPQLIEGGILLPERVLLSACLADQSRELSLPDPGEAAAKTTEVSTRCRFDLGALIELTAGGLRYRGEAETITLIIPDEVLEMPDLLLRTTVEVFAGHRLDDYDSGLTYPTLIAQLGRLRPGDRVEITFERGAVPGLRVRRASTP